MEAGLPNWYHSRGLHYLISGKVGARLPNYYHSIVPWLPTIALKQD